VIYREVLAGRHAGEGAAVLGELQYTHTPAHRQRPARVQAAGHRDELAARAVFCYAARTCACASERYYGFRMESVADVIGSLA
jgi:hypothetical protein